MRIWSGYYYEQRRCLCGVESEEREADDGPVSNRRIDPKLLFVAFMSDHLRPIRPHPAEMTGVSAKRVRPGYQIQRYGTTKITGPVHHVSCESLAGVPSVTATSMRHQFGKCLL